MQRIGNGNHDLRRRNDGRGDDRFEADRKHEHRIVRRLDDFGSRTFTGTTSSVASIGCDPWVFATVSTSPASVTVLAAADYSAAAASYNTLAFVDESTSAGTGTFSFTTGAASGGYGANLTNTSTATVCIFSSGTLTLTAVPAVGGNVTGSFSGGLVGDDPSFCPSTSTSKATSGTFSALREF